MCQRRQKINPGSYIGKGKLQELTEQVQAQHPRAVAISAATKQGLDDLRDAVIEMLSADFADAAVETDAGNGKVLSYLAAHAEIYRQEFHDNRVTIHCLLPRHLFHHIMGPAVSVRFLDGNGARRAAGNGHEQEE
jgi:GTP-binding protein HflX